MESLKKYYLAYKPFGMLSQFSGEQGDVTLAELNFTFEKDVYSIGRLDKDSEGLILLTNDNKYKTKLLDPKSKKKKVYWVQVEGDVTPEQIHLLGSGTIQIKHNKKVHRCAKALVNKIEEPMFLPDRIPPVRFRKNIPTTWLSIELYEGKNRQIRKMTAKAGCPTLRLVRVQMDEVFLPKEMHPGEVREYRPK